MPRKTGGKRQPIADCISGALVRINGDVFLAQEATDAVELMFAGDFVVRYGITYLGRPTVSIVPELVVADYGELLAGDQAWSFLMESAHLYPRADVCGRRSDGEEDMVALKQLDFDHPYHVFAYRLVDDRIPVAKICAILGNEHSVWPERLLRHLRCYDSVNDWRRSE